MGRASITARVVASTRRRVGRLPFEGGAADVEDRLTRSLSLPVPPPMFGTNAAYFRGRTRFFDEAVVGAVRDGVEQAVVIGAGYDGRAFRYGTPGTRWFEVDHPTTQADKRSRLAEIGADTSQVTFVPCDLDTDDLGAALAQAGHDADRSTFFMAEAVFPYVPVTAVERVLRAAAARRGPAGRLAVELGLVPHDRRARVNVAALRALTGLVGERIVTMQEPDEAFALLDRCGWTPRPSDPGLARHGHGRFVLWLLAD